MKRCLFILLLSILGTSAWAQYVPDGKVKLRKRPGSDISMYVKKHKVTEDEKLSILSDIDGKDYTNTWKTCHTINKVGFYTSGIGAAVGLVGFGIAAYGGLGMFIESLAIGVGRIDSGGSEEDYGAAIKEKYSPYINNGSLVAAIGFSVWAIGGIVWAAGYIPMEYIVFKYNRSRNNASTLALGPTNSGIGMSLSF